MVKIRATVFTHYFQPLVGYISPDLLHIASCTVSYYRLRFDVFHLSSSVPSFDQSACSNFESVGEKVTRIR